MVDRWIAFSDADSCGLLLDCLAARMVTFSRDCHGIIVAGACVAFCTRDFVSLTVVRVNGGPDHSTTVCNVACVDRTVDDCSFALCERAESYMLLDIKQCQLKLLELATHHVLRVIDMRMLRSLFFFHCNFFTI